jgi:2-deoxy-D-gluconate 3-dehydrogenase
MATKLIKDNINVTAIAPGAFKSDMNRAARDTRTKSPSALSGKRIGTDEDMAGMRSISPRGGAIRVGNTIAVDGGVVYANAGLRSRGRVQLDSRLPRECGVSSTPRP